MIVQAIPLVFFLKGKHCFFSLKGVDLRPKCFGITFKKKPSMSIYNTYHNMHTNTLLYFRVVDRISIEE